MITLCAYHSGFVAYHTQYVDSVCAESSAYILCEEHILETDKTRRKPPSRIKYERSHPVVSARLNQSDHNKLKKMLDSEGKSFAKFLQETIGKAAVKYDKAYDAGYNRGKEDWQIWYCCTVCGKRIDVKPKNNSHNAIIQYMKKNGWGHLTCKKNKQTNT